MLARRLVFLVAMVLGVGFSACGLRDKPAGTPQQKGATSEEEPADPPVFEDWSKTSGISFSYRNGEETANHLSILESLGGGPGLIDYDGDGLLDLFVPGGGAYAGKDRKEIVGYPCKLYRNLGEGRFKDVTSEVGLDRLAEGKPWFYTHGVAVADYDRDGWPDLLVTGWRRVALFRNVPVKDNDASQGRRFEEVTIRAGLADGIEWAVSAAFGDLDGDGYAELYVCQYVNWSWENNPPCSYDGKTPDICSPKSFAGLRHKLYRNTGKGTFVEVGQEAGLLPGGERASKGLGVLIADLDGDGKPDIYVANDTVDNFLYLNRSKPGQIRLEECGQLSGVAKDDRGGMNGSMGIDAGDPLREGKPSIWVTNYENELHALYRNECRPGVPFFNYHTQAAGIAALGQIYVGWGTAFVDVDLDGWEDLFVSNGHAIRHPVGKGVTRRQQPVLLHNQRGRFRSARSGLGEYGTKSYLGRGVAFGDLDNDGRIDLVLCPMNDPVTVLRGIGGKEHHWIGVQLQRPDHADYVGTRVEVTSAQGKQTRFAKGGGSYASANDRRLVFGLGKDRRVEKVEIIWPDGTRQELKDAKIDQYHLVRQEKSSR